jgi:hypothetical protein
MSPLNRPVVIEGSDDVEGLYILVLYRVGFQKISKNLEDLIFGIVEDCPQHNYVFHDATWPLGEDVAGFEFDVVILDVSFLCIRWLWPDEFESLKSKYNFLKNSAAVKVALPQDEYDCNELLDDWMVDWGVTAVFSCLSEHKTTIYPRYSRLGRVLPAFTGYVDESLVDVVTAPIAMRPVDIGYRTRRLPAYFGRTGQSKWKIGLIVKEKAIQSGLTVDIEVGEQHFILGTEWYEFIARCRTTLGASSGSSLLDPRGKIQRDVVDFCLRFPDATFEEIEAECFPGLDLQHEFTALSPRAIEAALLRSCQILVNGVYSNVLSPWEHYLPIDELATNSGEIFRLLGDSSLLQRYAERCRQAVLDEPKLRRISRSKEIISLALHARSPGAGLRKRERFRTLATAIKSNPRIAITAEWILDSSKRQIFNGVAAVPVLGRFAQQLWRRIKRNRLRHS